MTELVYSPTATESHEETALLRQRVATLELQLSSSRAATRAAYSALLERDMAATLEDGTPVLTLAFAHDELLRDQLVSTFVPASEE